jgi:hypothetical protein
MTGGEGNLQVDPNAVLDRDIEESVFGYDRRTYLGDGLLDMTERI